MDIQKEREVFEAWVGSNGRSIERFSDGSYKSMTLDKEWEAWQAAKAQADQKIKLLLCDEHLKKCESPTGIFNSQYPDEEPCLICLAKQARAQSVPEGFVLVPKEPNREFKDRLRSYLDNLWMGDHGCDWDYFVDAIAIKPNEIWQFMIEAQEPAND